MPAHLLYGDSFLVAQQLKRLTAEAGADSLLEANRHQLTGGQFNLPELLAVCNALPFMDSHRLVVVTGLLGALESRGGRGRGSRPLGEWDKAGGGRSQYARTPPCCSWWTALSPTATPCCGACAPYPRSTIFRRQPARPWPAISRNWPRTRVQA